MTLYSYCLRHDSGAAPNPYWGICSLVICKPQIRIHANIGDWIVGLGSKNSAYLGDISNEVIYAMKVTKKMTMAEYDKYCLKQLPSKVPDWNNKDFRRRVGDSIYDYPTSDTPQLRKSVHNERNRDTDLKGKYALLSDHFWYFGNKPIKLPDNLSNIMHPSPNHKSKENTKYISDFVKWIESQEKIQGIPELHNKLMYSDDYRRECAAKDKIENEKDEIC